MKFQVPAISRYFPRAGPSGALALIALSFANCASLAADPAAPAIAASHLRIDHAAAFRLATFAPTAPAIETRQEPAIPLRFAGRRFARIIDEAARNASLDPALVHAIIAVESAYNPAARSVKGAIGLMQVLPATASRYGVPDPASSPEANLRAGTRYLGYLMGLFNNRIDLVLAAYNAGENAVLRHGQRIPPFPETLQYVPAVLARYREWQEPVPPALPTAAVPARIEYMPGTQLELSTADAAAYRSASSRRPAQR